MERCPKCLSTRISIDGVLQRKHGALYYITGGPIADAGARAGTKFNHAIRGKKENAVCMNCGYEWVLGAESPAASPTPAAPAAKPAVSPAPAASPTPAFCRKCGTKTEPGDVYCVECGAKL